MRTSISGGGRSSTGGPKKYEKEGNGGNAVPVYNEASDMVGVTEENGKKKKEKKRKREEEQEVAFYVCSF